jgi:hypothetical protein
VVDRLEALELEAEYLRTAQARAHRGKRGVPPDPEKLEEARRAYKAARLRLDIERAVQSAPPLTGEQRAELAAILAGGAA